MRKGNSAPREPPVPSVPSFGGEIALALPPKPAAVSKQTPSAGANKLGLNPSLGGPVVAVASDDSGDEDNDNDELDDEEAAYSALKSGP